MSGLNLPQEEERVLAFWERERIFVRSVDERPASNRYVFYEGPPTANGKPGIHHVLGRTFKDAIPRYKTMRGYRVERKAGWDTHGLPVELQVEKQLGISGKPQIETIVQGDVAASIAKFNALCRESVWQYKDEWERLTKRMGFWLDMEHPYVTLDTDYIESVWWILKQVWDKDLLYEDFKIVPYCTRCGTALSSHEVATGYDEVTDRSVYLKFPVIGRERTYLLAWTTTPWTLPGNVALAVNPDVTYSVFEHPSGERYILADDREAAVFGTAGHAKTPLTSDELLSMRYESLFTVPALVSDASYKVYPAGFVTTGDGTGIVHTAVMYGEDDFALGTAVGLPKHHTVDLDGNFTADVIGFAGKKAKDPVTEDELLAALSERELVFKEEPYTHTYPFCWRCATPLLYYGKRSWFIRMSALRDELIARNDTVRWVPDHLKDGRFGEWLREVKDWAISRDRYWGTPLPVWRCQDCDAKRCVGSIAELAEAAGAPVPSDLHRPGIDALTIPCQSCPGTMTRYPEVIDVWFDSGAMPFAQQHYPFEHADRIDAGQDFPADYIAEGIDQTRGWFYTLLAVATLLDRPAPYKAVVSLGLVLDKAGKKMSKSKGNIVDPWAAIDEFGIDPIRWYFYSVNQPADTKRFDPADIAQAVRKVFLPAWNMTEFLALHDANGRENDAEPSDAAAALDAWLGERRSQVIADVTLSLDAFDFFHATQSIRDYLTELSTWYVRLSRKRDDAQFAGELRTSLKTAALLLAPFTPFFAELLWERVRSDTDPVSVHLAAWPDSGHDRDGSLLAPMASAMALVERGRAVRAKLGIAVRQPLASFTFVGEADLAPGTAAIIAQELNVKQVLRTNAGDPSFDTVITPELKAEGLARELTRSIQQLRKDAGLQPTDPAAVTIAGPADDQDMLKTHIPGIEQTTDTVITFVNSDALPDDSATAGPFRLSLTRT